MRDVIPLLRNNPTYRPITALPYRTYQTMYKESYERDAKDVFQSAVSSVLPEAMLKSSLKLNANTLTVAG